MSDTEVRVDREALVDFVLAPGFAADRPSGPRTQKGHALASSLRRRLPKVEIDYDEWVRDVEVEAVSSALAASPSVTEGLDWLLIFDRATGGDGNRTHGQDRFGFNSRVDEQVREYARLRSTPAS